MSPQPRLLAVDCATLPASVAVVEGARIRAVRVHDDERRSDAWVGPAIGACLTESDVAIAGLDGLAAAVGPGTFTGIRVGIATCLGIAAPLGLPVAGIRTLDALAAAHAAEGAPLAACIDARRGQVYVALYRPTADPTSLPLETSWGPHVADPADVAEELGKHDGVVLCGNGAAVVGAHGTFGTVEVDAPLAATIGCLAAGAWQEAAEQTGWPPPEPVYLRPPDATPPRNPLRDLRRDRRR